MGAAPGLQEADSTTPHTAQVWPQGWVSVHCTPRGQESGGRGAPDPTRASPPAPWVFCKHPAHKMPEWELVMEQELNLKPEKPKTF